MIKKKLKPETEGKFLNLMKGIYKKPYSQSLFLTRLRQRQVYYDHFYKTVYCIV
jgi:hypothetical protein